MIEDLYLCKQYEIETLFLAVSLSDRYIKKVLESGAKLPCLLTLTVICIHLAAKIEEHARPCLQNTIEIMKEKHSILLQKQAILNFEEKIIRMLEGDLRATSPIPFLERYVRLFGFDML